GAKFFLVPAGDDDIGPHLDQAPGHGLAQALAAPRDQGRFTRQLEHFLKHGFFPLGERQKAYSVVLTLCVRTCGDRFSTGPRTTMVRRHTDRLETGPHKKSQPLRGSAWTRGASPPQ